MHRWAIICACSALLLVSNAQTIPTSVSATTGYSDDQTSTGLTSTEALTSSPTASAFTQSSSTQSFASSSTASPDTVHNTDFIVYGITLAYEDGAAVFTMPQNFAVIMKNSLRSMVCQPTDPHPKFKRATGTYACPVSNAKALLQVASPAPGTGSTGNEIYNNLIMMPTDFPDLIPDMQVAVLQIIAFARTQIQWPAWKVNNALMSSIAVMVFFLALSYEFSPSINMAVNTIPFSDIATPTTAISTASTTVTGTCPTRTPVSPTQSAVVSMMMLFE